MRYGLLGEKLSHSYSPQIHKALGNYPYELIQVSPQALDAFMKTADFAGLNITVPYKKAVLPYCGALSPIAERLGAINTIIKRNDGTLYGHNTDYFGFQEMVHISGLDVRGKKVLVLGSGGAGVTVNAVLQDMGANTVTISREGENNYQNLHLHEDASVIVNATPVGMFPNTGVSPIDLTDFPHLEGVLDLIYNPCKTELLLQAEMLGLVAVNGLFMLVAQAKGSAEYFTGEKIPDRIIVELYNMLKRQMENIVLIGMPGSGKTTIGRILAESLNREFVDTDQLIVQKVGMSIPAYMEQFGIEKFRQEEAAVIREVCRQSGLVIATGGGCVTQEENYNPLRQNGKIIWIQREITSLPTDGRPLSQADTLQAMYEVRRPLYSRFCDIVVNNDDTVNTAIQAILKAYKGENYEITDH